MSRALHFALVLLAGLVLASGARAQAPEPAPTAPARSASAPSLEVTALSCPECACDRARADVLRLRDEYRMNHRLASTTAPRLLMLGGFIGAGGAGLLTAIAMRQSEGETQTRLLLLGSAATAIALGVGVMGLHWYRERKREAAPHRARDEQLRLALHDARSTQRAHCRR